MMLTTTSALRETALRLTRRAFPEYKGRKITVNVTGRCLLYNLHWSEGCRNYYEAIRLDGALSEPISPSARAPWDEKLEGESVDVPKGVAIVILHFSGTSKYVTVHFSKEDCLS